MAAAEITPSGVPPTPISRSTPVPDLRGGDRRGDVSVANQVDARAGLAELGDQVVVAVALEDDDGEVVDVDVLRLGHALEVLRRGRVDVDRVGRFRPHRDLVHVQRGAGEEQRSPLRDRDHRDRVRHPEGRQPRSLQRIDRDVHLGAGAVADLLAVEEHRRLVLLALADDDDAAHRDRVQHQPHRVDRCLVGGDLVASTDPARCERGRRLRDADELEREVPVWDGPIDVAHVV